MGSSHRGRQSDSLHGTVVYIINATQVNPAYTSTWCSKCETTLDENRQSQAKFCCVNCGYEVNAAKNIGFRPLHAGQKSPHRGATRHLALKLGALKVNGGYSPAIQ
ncbi:zinc ribbon domain-containing protein [Halorubrum coriense]|uniref:zinc ribbon domain-containing protein n=1 Tax=Halorubrum coriense TaxID=64713 RepID=UPI0023A95975|nr:zinc ribbon domain-containing protein [Halorubrum coriense]